jgi:hypothetical protein
VEAVMDTEPRSLALAILINLYVKNSTDRRLLKITKLLTNAEIDPA